MKMFCGLRALLKKNKSSNNRSAEKMENAATEPKASDNIENIKAAENSDNNVATKELTAANEVEKKSIECQTLYGSLTHDDYSTFSPYGDPFYMPLGANVSGSALYKQFVLGAQAQDNATVANAIGNTNVAQSEVAMPLKHPLQSAWTLWYYVHDECKTWEEMQNEITSFDTVEDFWEVNQRIVPPSELNVFCQYSIFKQNIRPMWEDAANRNGGRWILNMHKAYADDMDEIWLDLVLSLIGEQFVNMDEVCGAIVNRSHRCNKISIWTSNGNNEQAILEIGYKMREILRLTPQHALQYQLHLDSILLDGKRIKPSYVI